MKSLLILIKSYRRHNDQNLICGCPGGSNSQILAKMGEQPLGYQTDFEMEFDPPQGCPQIKLPLISLWQLISKGILQDSPKMRFGISMHYQLSKNRKSICIIPIFGIIFDQKFFLPPVMLTNEVILQFIAIDFKGIPPDFVLNTLTLFRAG